MDLLPAPAPLFAAIVAGGIYVRGWRRRPRRPVGQGGGEAWRFASGLVVAVLALSPALEGLAEASFAWHMVQHQLLILVAAPLIASARPLTTAAWAAGRRSVRSRADGWFVRAAGWLAIGAGAVHLATVLAWHLPPLYDAAMTDPQLHHLEHLTLFGTAAVAWGAILTAARDPGARALAAVVGLSLNALAGAGLGVVLLAAPLPLFGSYAHLGAVALDQQRVGGALMKVSAVMVYAGAAVWIVTRWLHRLSEEPAGSTAAAVQAVQSRTGAGSAEASAPR
jgi:putative membrane protein